MAQFLAEDVPRRVIVKTISRKFRHALLRVTVAQPVRPGVSMSTFFDGLSGLFDQID